MTNKRLRIAVCLLTVGLLVTTFGLVSVSTNSAEGGAIEAAIKGWKKGTGWGWIWGKEDEVGALNAMTPQSALSAIGMVKQGKVYDMGVTYGRNSYKWPGHSPCEVLTFRGPEGTKRQQDYAFMSPKQTASDRDGIAVLCSSATMSPRKLTAWDTSPPGKTITGTTAFARLIGEGISAFANATPPPFRQSSRGA